MSDVLQASPAAPRTRFQTWGRRLLKTLLVLAVILVAAHAVEYVRGTRALERAKADWAAAGLPDADTFFKNDAPPAAAENLLDAPFFQEFQNTAAAVRKQPESRFLRWSGLRPGKHGEPIRPEILFTAACPEAIRLAHAEGRTDAALVIDALEREFPELKDLSKTLVERPKTSFRIRYPAPDKLYTNDFPAFKFQHAGTTVLALYAQAKLLEGDAATAHAATVAMLRHGRALGEIKYLSTGMATGAVLEDGALPVIRLALERRAWTEAQLGEIETHLAAISPTEILNRSLTGETLASTGVLENIAVEDWAPNAMDESTRPALSLIFPVGWLKLDAAEHFDAMRAVLPAAGKPLAAPLHKRQAAQLETRNEAYRPWNMMHKLAMPALTGLTARAVTLEAGLACTRLAVALERHRLAHGDHPESLAALTPAFLPAIPAGIETGAAPTYSKNTPASGYTLTYAGENFHDLAPTDRPDITGDAFVWTLGAPAK